eukprot:m.69676 g.69676  ORF g.69676 m.69676 type:complete len:154 (+) comp12235_c0_seq2:110-571(+)
MPPRKQQSAKGRAAPSGKSKAAGSAKRGKSAVKGATTAKKAKKATLPKQLQASAIQQVDRPVPSKDFLVEPEAVQNALAVWDFCYTHSEPLKLSRFTFDMFQQALKDREPPMDPLSREGFCLHGPMQMDKCTHTHNIMLMSTSRVQPSLPLPI